MAAGAWGGGLNGRGNAAALGLSAVCLARVAGSWWAGWLDRPLPLVVDAGRRAVGGMHRLVVARAGVPGWPLIPARPCASFFSVLALWLAACRGAGAHPRYQFLCCRCSPWCGWLTSLRILPAGLLACALPCNKLAPSISPGKSWEGVWGGLAGVLVPGRGLGWLTVISRRRRQFYTRLYSPAGWWFLGHCRGVHGGHECGGVIWSNR